VTAVDSSARDRAITEAADVLIEQGWIATSSDGDGAFDVAQVVIDRLIRRPEVLRALAGDTASATLVDWSARFRAAADEAKREGFDAVAAHLGEAAEYMRLPGRAEAVGQALAGESS
jgi:hypothetical protein